jgi:hypothetical protein
MAAKMNFAMNHHIATCCPIFISFIIIIIFAHEQDCPVVSVRWHDSEVVRLSRFAKQPRQGRADLDSRK